MGLDEKAIETVRNWKFEPAMLNGKPVAVEIKPEVNFRLSSPSQTTQETE
jgi:protein TonB